ncbi:hypothetical protein [Burkholderia gladioli]|uniref:hypothetical protein n=1 Tax=Burkholderia gladioli TaxID=28095 RepID=UPI00163F88A1|nr:hypothetical protein [Burkholderia gladioli]
MLVAVDTVAPLVAIVMTQRHRAEVAGALRATMPDAHVMHIGLRKLRPAEQRAANTSHLRDAAHVLALALV